MADTNLGSIKIAVVGDLSQAVTAFATLGRTVSATVASIGQQLKTLGAGFASMETLVSAAFAGKSLQQFKTLDDAFTSLRQSLQLTSGEFEPFRKEIVAAATRANIPMQALVESMRRFTFATSDTRQLLTLATAAFQGATISSSSMDAAAKALNTTLRSFNLSLAQAPQIMAQLANASERGRFNMDELGAALSQVAPAANSLGLRFEEVLAILKSLTDQTGDAGEAASRLRVLLTKFGGLDEASKAGQKLADALGRSVRESIRAEGLTRTLQRMAQAADGVNELSAALDGAGDSVASLGVGERSMASVNRILSQSGEILAQQQRTQAVTAEELVKQYRDQKKTVTELARETGKLISNKLLEFFERNRETIASVIENVNKLVKSHGDLIGRFLQIGVALSAYAVALSGVRFVLSALGSTAIFVSGVMETFMGVVAGAKALSDVNAMTTAFRSLASAITLQGFAARSAAAANQAGVIGQLAASAVEITAQGRLRNRVTGAFAGGINGASAAETVAVPGAALGAAAPGAIAAIGRSAAASAGLLGRLSVVAAGVTAAVAGLATIVGDLREALEPADKETRDLTESLREYDEQQARLVAAQSVEERAGGLRASARELNDQYKALAESLKVLADLQADPAARTAAVNAVEEQTAAIAALTRVNRDAVEALAARRDAIEEEIEAGRRSAAAQAFANTTREAEYRLSGEGLRVAVERAEAVGAAMTQEEALARALRLQGVEEQNLQAAIRGRQAALREATEALATHSVAALTAAANERAIGDAIRGAASATDSAASAIKAMEKSFDDLGLTEHERELKKYDEATDELADTLETLNKQAEAFHQALADIDESGVGDADAAIAGLGKVLAMAQRVRTLMGQVAQGREGAVAKQQEEEAKKIQDIADDVTRARIEALQREEKLKEAADLAARARHARELRRATEIRNSKVAGAAEAAAAIEAAAERALAGELANNVKEEQKRREATEAHQKVKQRAEEQTRRAEALTTAEILRRRLEQARLSGDVRTELELREQITQAIKESGDAQAEAADSEEQMLRNAQERLDLLKEEVNTRLRTKQGLGEAFEGAERDVAGASSATDLRGALRGRFRQTETEGGARQLFDILRQILEAEYRALRDQLSREQDPEERVEIQKQLREVEEKARIATEELARALRELATRAPGGAGEPPLVIAPSRLEPGEELPPGAVSTSGTAAPAETGTPGLDLLTDEERRKLLNVQRGGNQKRFDELRDKFLSTKTSTVPDELRPPADPGPEFAVDEQGLPLSIPDLGGAITAASEGLAQEVGGLQEAVSGMGEEVVGALEELTSVVTETADATNANTAAIREIRRGGQAIRIEGRADGGGD